VLSLESPATLPTQDRLSHDRPRRVTGAENSFAVVVGTKMPGRLLSGSAFKVGHGYVLGLPVAAYLTWQERMLDKIVPKFSVELSRNGLEEGRDTQLDTALEIAKRCDSHELLGRYGQSILWANEYY
jgi:C-terminal processing protease CtpA/Prc